MARRNSGTEGRATRRMPSRLVLSLISVLVAALGVGVASCVSAAFPATPEMSQAGPDATEIETTTNTDGGTDGRTYKTSDAGDGASDGTATSKAPATSTGTASEHVSASTNSTSEHVDTSAEADKPQGTAISDSSSSTAEAKTSASSSAEQATSTSISTSTSASTSASTATAADEDTDLPKTSDSASSAEKDKTSGAQKSPASAAASEPSPTRFELAGEAAAHVRASEAFAPLTQTIASFEERDWTVAFVLYDVKTKQTLAYDADQELYPASSIKAPFTCAIYEKLVESGATTLDVVSPVSTPTILESSDEGYRQLHAMYGEDAFISWLEEAGVGPGSYGTMRDMVVWNYPHISANQLSLMWRHIYAYLKGTDSEASRHLADLLEHREVSSLRKAVGKDVKTWSKMGWFESFSDYRSEPATVEGGVVFAKDGTYVLALMTTAPAELDELVGLLSALDGAHTAFA